MHQLNVLIVVTWICALIGTSCTTRTLPAPLESRGWGKERYKFTNAVTRFIKLFNDGNTSAPCKCGFSKSTSGEEVETETGTGVGAGAGTVAGTGAGAGTGTGAGADGEGRVVGGARSRRYEFPWHVGLVSLLGVLPFCGGSLVSDRWVLTAAHCVDRRSLTRTLVLLSSHSPLSPRALRLAVRDIVVHPDFDRETYSHDMALLELSVPLPLEQLGGAVAPICLPEPGPPPPEGTAAGWGAIFVGTPPAARLRKVTLPMMTLSECNNTLSGQVDSSMICAGGDRFSGTCHRDDGGSLMTLNSDGRYQISGVSSWARACTVLGHPSVFAAVEGDVIEWIQITTAGSRFCGD